MEITIQTSGHRLSATAASSMRTHIRKRIEEVFGRIRQRVTRVTVHLSDANGPGDKHCVMRVSLPGVTALVQDSDRNPFALINRVSASAAAIALRRLKPKRNTVTIRKLTATHDDEAIQPET
jgi:ribosome-associated translation inhibitor RaiA